MSDVDGVCYLVHSLNVRGFADRDRAGAEVVRDAVRGQRRTPRRLPLRPGPRRARRGALAAHLLPPRGRAGARRGGQRALLGALAARGRRDRRRLHVLRGDPSARDAAARAAGAELAGAPGPADRRQRRAPRDGRGVRRRPPDRRPRHRRTERAAVLAPARRVRPRRRPAARARAHPAGARRRWSASARPRMVRRTLLDGQRPDREPAPRDGLPAGRDLGARRTGSRSSASARRWPAPSARPGSGPEAPLASDPDWTRMRAPILDELHAPATVRAGPASGGCGGCGLLQRCSFATGL